MMMMMLFIDGSQARHTPLSQPTMVVYVTIFLPFPSLLFVQVFCVTTLHCQVVAGRVREAGLAR